MDLNTGSKKIEGEVRLETKKEIKSVSDLKKELLKFSDKSVSEILDIILIGTIILDSSDIHIEPEEGDIKLRLRIDGMLQDITVFDEKTYASILSRIKLLSGLKLNIEDKPQDGRFSIFLGNQSIETRVSSLPGQYGESLVLRILNPKSLVGIELLGLRDELLKLFNEEISKPNGMIIVTGPTGSGKSTTLYSFLKKIQSPEIKVITIEDPIEYELKGIVQTQVNPEKGYDFPSGLKAIVRQDPDVILVGEIRDKETADIALQAALTGHLVFSTLHTNDAAGTIARLAALGAEVSNIGPAVNLIIAQRLARKICNKCGAMEKVTAEELQIFKKELAGVSKKEKIPELDKDLKVPRAKGCDFCNNTGYKGRTGIFEALVVDDDMERFLSSHSSISDLRDKAKTRGMITMLQDGLIKVLKGETTLKEVERVAKE